VEPEDFDLNAFVADTLPDLVDAEAADDWAGLSVMRRPGGDHYRPATDLMADDSPLQQWLHGEDLPPDGLSRTDRHAFHDARRDAQRAAREAAMDAEELHHRIVDIAAKQRAGDIAIARMTAAGRAALEKKKAEAEGTTWVPVRGPETDLGRW
jgi:hypothetical protein